MPRLKVVCTEVDDFCGRGVEYVRKLKAGIARHLPVEHDFICFSDREHEGVETRGLPPGLPGWWNSLYLFSRGQFAPDDRILYFDLDVVITDDLSFLAGYDGPFAGLRDPYYPDQFWWTVGAWRGDECARIWDRWNELDRPLLRMGDQMWMQMMRPDAVRLQDVFPKKIVSYKVHARRAVPDGAAVVGFHGLPRPHECEGWVAERWVE